MRVSQLAKILNITAETIRFYTRIGVLHPQKNSSNGYRDYSKKDIGRMQFILSSRQLGFSVDDIQKILAEADQKQSPCSTVRRLIDHRLHETEERFNRTIKLRDRMREAIKLWDRQPDKKSSDDSICHLIEIFSTQSKEE